jgi:hypothetical protein
LIDEINETGNFYAVYCSLEALDGYENPKQSLPMIVDMINDSISSEMVLEHVKIDKQPHGDLASGILNALHNISLSLDKPLIIFFDEADCLSGQTLISFLRQLRTGHNRKHYVFPWSISLIGMRNIRDYKAKIRPETESLGTASPFNVITESLTLQNFTVDQIAELYRQHTECTGQIFEDEAIERAYYWSHGQPWLVNAMARQVVEIDLLKDYTITITAAHIDHAAETIILSRDVHIDSLLDRLKEPRVQKVIEPILYGGDAPCDFLSDDMQYCLNLGLIKGNSLDDIHIANPIYNEGIIRTLNNFTKETLPKALINKWMNGNTINMSALLQEFQTFWRENADIWIDKYTYKEAAPQLILSAFLQRVANGNASIMRETALGTGRVDLSVRYAGKAYPIELKLAGSQPLPDSLEQVEKCMDRCGSDEGWLGIFDRSSAKPWSEKIYWKDEQLKDGRTVHLFGC